jgi:hypothetical protein
MITISNIARAAALQVTGLPDIESETNDELEEK